jgi:hypothetical protein
MERLKWMKECLISLLLVAGNVLQAAEKHSAIHELKKDQPELKITGKVINPEEFSSEESLSNRHEHTLSVWNNPKEINLRSIYLDILCSLEKYTAAGDIEIADDNLSELREAIEKDPIIQKRFNVYGYKTFVLSKEFDRPIFKIMKKDNRIVIQRLERVLLDPDEEGYQRHDHVATGIALELFSKPAKASGLLNL